MRFDGMGRECEQILENANNQNRKSNKHLNPQSFRFRFHFHLEFVLFLPVSLILHGSTTVEPMAMLYFWPIVKNPGEWLSSSIKLSWYLGVAITPICAQMFGLDSFYVVVCLFVFWHGNRRAHMVPIKVSGETKRSEEMMIKKI